MNKLNNTNPTENTFRELRAYYLQLTLAEGLARDENRSLELLGCY